MIAWEVRWGIGNYRISGILVLGISQISGTPGVTEICEFLKILEILQILENPKIFCGYSAVGIFAVSDIENSQGSICGVDPHHTVEGII